MRKIGVVTGNRAEYGLLKRLLKKLNLSTEIELILYVTGSHLDASKGYTVHEIEGDDLQIDKRIPIPSVSEETSVAEIMGEVLFKFSEIFKSEKLDILVVLGDRFEIFAVVTAAVTFHIPIAHIHGGEVSIGSIDNQWRNGITKLSNFHFCATEEFANRVRQMGEDSSYVMNCGALGVENVKNIKLLSKVQLEKGLGFTFETQNFLLTYHPETALSDTQIRKHFKNILSAVEKSDANIIITYPNADRGHNIIMEESKLFYKRNKNRCLLIESLGLLRYLSCLKYVDLVIGNSSSGLIEVPSFKIPTINVGDRQLGRLAPKSVIHSGYEEKEIMIAIEKGLSKEFNTSLLGEFKNPYEGEQTSKDIVNFLSNVKLEGVIFKKFVDLN